jgi:hypothetical protein
LVSGTAPPRSRVENLRTRYFGSFGASEAGGDRRRCSVTGVVATAVAIVEVRLEDGSVIPAQLVDVGDERVRFFVAVWSGARCAAVVARDPGGGELEAKTFRRLRG